MAIKATYCKHTLNFKFDAGTSRGVLKTKDSFFIRLASESQPGVFGIGEAAPLKGLSIDYKDSFESYLAIFIEKLNEANLEADNIAEAIHENTFDKWPSIRFAFEMALLDLQNGGKRVLFENGFSLKQEEIEINGLVWMGDENFMAKQIVDKLKSGFRTIKMKVGAIDFDKEISLLRSIRKNFSAEQLTLRVDANGAFSPSESKTALIELAKLNIHSIEQPIKARQWDSMAELCRISPIPIALDEELIGISEKNREELINHINPQFLIFKPTLLGGFRSTDEWIALAAKKNIGWWLTSALEANIGLNAICQYTASKNTVLPQGLGTGSLFGNNIPCPLTVEAGYINLNGPNSWNLSPLSFK